MTPGRELDALVAEKVFGAVVHWHEEAKFDGSVVTKVSEPYAPLPSNPAMGTKRLPHYSTDIAAAWEVVEKLKMSVHAPQAPYAYGEYHAEDKWEAECEKNADSECFIAQAATAPLAICLAALKAVG